MVLRCHAASARDYVDEAVACYKAGAYRSSIITIWIAVYFDLVDKLRVHAVQGIQEAKSWIDQYDRACSAYDPAKHNTAVPLLQKESEILAKCARPEIGIISNVERLDLNRLKDDRNRCAHPTLLNEVDRFVPTPELARVHMRTALDAVLTKAAVPGKLMAQRILGLCHAQHFPIDTEHAREELDHQFGQALTDEVLHMVIPDLVETMYSQESATNTRLQAAAALGAIGVLAPDTTRNLFDNIITKTSNEADSMTWSNVIGSLHRIEWAWQALTDRNRIVVRRVVESLGMQDPDASRVLVQAAVIPELHDAVVTKLPILSLHTLWSRRDSLGLDVVQDEIIRRIDSVDSYTGANSLLKSLMDNLSILEHVPLTMRLLEAMAENSEFSSAFELPVFLASIVRDPDIPIQQLQSEFCDLLNTMPAKIGGRRTNKGSISRALDQRLARQESDSEVEID